MYICIHIMYVISHIIDIICVGICKYEGGSVVLTIINVAYVLSTGLYM